MLRKSQMRLAVATAGLALLAIALWATYGPFPREVEATDNQSTVSLDCSAAVGIQTLCALPSGTTNVPVDLVVTNHGPTTNVATPTCSNVPTMAWLAPPPGVSGPVLLRSSVKNVTSSSNLCSAARSQTVTR